MRVTTILNRVEKHKGFVYEKCLFGPKGELHVKVRPDRRHQGICSRCDTPGPTYDTQPERRFQYLPILGFMVFFLYAMRRIDCPKCQAVVVERVPWALGKSPITITFAWFLATWARRMSWLEVSRAFQVSWAAVAKAVAMAVEWGMARRSLDDVETIGVDEIFTGRAGKYMTVVYQLDEGRRRLLWMGKGHTEASLGAFFDFFGERSARLRYVASDMWQAYLNVIRERAPQALHVLDRFHISMNLNKAIDEVRAAEVKDLKARGEAPVLTKTRWILLRRPDKLSTAQTVKLSELVRANLNVTKAYLLKEDLRQLWDELSSIGAGLFLSDWCERAKASKLPPIARVARTLGRHSALILNWFHARGTISSGVVEGFNNKIRVITRRAYGMRTPETLQTALFHALGGLPEPVSAHRFW